MWEFFSTIQDVTFAGVLTLLLITAMVVAIASLAIGLLMVLERHLMQKRRGKMMMGTRTGRCYHQTCHMTSQSKCSSSLNQQDLE